jgi:hypothetical protein
MEHGLSHLNLHPQVLSAAHQGAASTSEGNHHNMSRQHQLAAASVANWPAVLKTKLPKPLQAALDRLDAIRWVEVGHRPQFDLAAVTDSNAEALIRAYAEQITLSSDLMQPPGGGGGQSVLNVAKNQAYDLAASEVLREAGSAVPELLAAAKVEFDKAVNEFITAVDELPDEVTAEVLVQAGPSTVERYQTAKAAQARIAEFDAWLAALSDVPGYGGQAEPLLRVLTPTTLQDLHELEKAKGKPGLLNPVLVQAVKANVAFTLNTPKQAAQIREALEAAARAAMLKQRQASVGR